MRLLQSFIKVSSSRARSRETVDKHRVAGDEEGEEEDERSASFFHLQRIAKSIESYGGLREWEKEVLEIRDGRQGWKLVSWKTVEGFVCRGLLELLRAWESKGIYPPSSPSMPFRNKVLLPGAIVRIRCTTPARLAQIQYLCQSSFIGGEE